MQFTSIHNQLLFYVARHHQCTLTQLGYSFGHSLKQAEKAALAELVDAEMIHREKGGPYCLAIEGFWYLLYLHFNHPQDLPGVLKFSSWNWSSMATNLMDGKGAQWYRGGLSANDKAVFGASGATRVFGNLSLALQKIIVECWQEEEFLGGQALYPWGDLRMAGEGIAMAERLSYMQFEQENLLLDREYECPWSAANLVGLLRDYRGEAGAQCRVLEQALFDWRTNSKQKGFFPGALTIIWLGLMAVMGADLARWQKEVLTWAKKQMPWLVSYVDLLDGKTVAFIDQVLLEWRGELEAFTPQSYVPFGQLWLALCLIWAAQENRQGATQLADWQVEPFLSAPPQHLLMALCQDLLRLLLARPTTLAIFTVSRPEQWERWLAALPSSRGPQPKRERLVWQLGSRGNELVCRLQKESVKGGWSSGRLIHNMWDVDNLYPEVADEKDLQIAHRMQRSYFHGPDIATLRLLAEHPRLQTSEGTPLALLLNSPLLAIRELEGRWQATLMSDGKAIAVTAHKKIMPIAADLWQVEAVPEPVQELLPYFENMPELPAEALPKLADALNQIPQLDWICDHPELASHTRLSACPVDAVVLADLQKETLNLQLVNQLAGGKAIPLGNGAEFIKDWQTPHHYWQRTLKQERALAKKVVKALGLAGKGPWSLSGVELIPMLERFAALDDLGVRLQWHSDSQRVSLIGEEALTLRIEQQQEWFAIDGELLVDQQQVLDLRLLLRQISSGRRYITLEGKQAHMMLSEGLLARLTTLAALVDEKQQVSQRLAYPLMHLLEQGAVSGDQGWQTLTDAWRQEAHCPAELMTPLREYQQVGVQWMANLALHRFGACLADDMGLGKTIQALTLLRLRKEQGPALVIVPKSLLANWCDEAARFAPDLTVQVLNEQQDRGAALANLGPGALLLTTYGLVASHGELGDISWATIVADEAQQIKNASTARAKALFNLDGAFRLALSGTPVENHLGELWSLFNFINPGLLGNKTQFKQRFGKASRDPAHLAQLKGVIAPFVLRRLKREVLAELPEKTEIVHHVELSGEEQALYEASRREAVSQMESGEGHNLMLMLSNLTRLRRICCSPALILPDWQQPQSKLDAAMELALEAIDNGHRILVFSQFVDLLTLLRQRLADADLDYCYLDGSCSTKQRQQAIERFKTQAIPLFLISLKAGGTGLNLTEADTVIHLDPWWNPAVEDQASDRVHRIGQTEPVTVYRLMCEQTVEEKIVALHAQKRELAEGVLGDQHQVAQIDADVIRGLLTTG
ncbi:DEAD/DEAH box helicase [Aeromonas fluvialis]|uniref:DEAD/DEAH box helicase n=1 Tax=Aeromonas fluvialis TaxID=591962 RepID=UPI00069355C0|nr:DEAD/DEAH box helicase [Aeromonas fluvialis]